MLARLSLLVVGTLAMVSPTTAQRFLGNINTWVAEDRLHPPPSDALLFVGSSSIRRWESLSREFSDYEIIQRGFGGSQFSDLNFYVPQIVLPYDPAAIIVFEGTNDVASGKSAQAVFQDYLQFVNLVHTGQSQARSPIPIFFISITPTPARWGQWSIADSVNRLIQMHAQSHAALHYIDIATPFLASGQPPVASLFVLDRLHLSPSGYALFASEIHRHVSSVMPSTRVFQLDPKHPAVGERVRIDLGPSNVADGHHTLGPDPSGDLWNNWHALDGGVGILAGQALGDLITTSGSPTGIDLVIAGGFNSNGILNGGLLSPSTARLGTLAVGTATEDYFFANNLDTPGGFAITGLSPWFEYRLRLFATRNTSEVRTTRYTVFSGNGKQSVDLQTSGPGSGVGSNGNDDDVVDMPGLVPDHYGQLFLDVERIAGSFSYLGLIELEVTDEIRVLGTGCGSGPPALAMSFPRIGSAWSFDAHELSSGSVGLLALSFGQPSPLMVLPSCTLHLGGASNIFQLAPVVAGSLGQWSGQVPIPLLASLDGVQVTVQVAMRVGQGLELSNGLRGAIRK